MADVKWIKITTDIFDDEKILLIESLPDPYAIITCWFKLLCLAGKQNNSGVFMMGRIAYTDKMLATIFRMNEATVTMALKTFEQFGMVEIVDGVITIPNWNKHQSLDAYEKRKERDRLYQAQKRAAQKALITQSSDKSSDESADKSSDIAFIEGDREEDKDIDIDKKKECTDFQSVVDLFHKICVSYPKVRSLSEARKKAIKARLKTYSMDDFRTVFENAENSSFLKGKNDRNWSANFDWLIADKNMAKVLEGNYADKPSRYGRKEKLPDWFGKRELDEDEERAIQRMMSEPKELGVAEHMAIQRIMSEEDQAEAEQLRRELQEAFGGRN